MKLAYFPKQIALNGQQTLRFFLNSTKTFGFTPVEDSMNADAAVIWSVLWNGRLRYNKLVFEHYRMQNKPVFILEVGLLKRGYTWKISLNDITAKGIYGNTENLDVNRPGKIGISLSPLLKNRNKEILIACQHQKSHQWNGNPSTYEWIQTTISNIRSYTNRTIIVRPHPRSPLLNKIENAIVISPKKLINSHDEYDINYGFHCVINHNSGPSVISAIRGTPIICDKSSLAWPMSGTYENIETIELPDRQDWFIKICHTEWTNEEIQSGIPMRRLIPYI